MSIELFSLMLSEDDIMREALQEIWEMGQGERPPMQPEDALERVYEIVNAAVTKLDTLTQVRQALTGEDRSGPTPTP